MWMKVKLALVLILTIVTVILVAQNTQLMTTRFLFWEITQPRSMSFMLIFLLGSMFGCLLTLFVERKRRKSKQKKLEKTQDVSDQSNEEDLSST